MAITSKLPLHNEESYQKYHMLCDQRDLLKQRLELQLPTTNPFYTQQTPEDVSSHPSPTLSRTNYSVPMDISRALSPTSHASSAPISFLPNSSNTTRGRRVSDPISHDSAEARALYVLNQEIKATLTELLNTDSVKQDDKFRVHVQSKLMDAERELKLERRRRSSVDPYGSVVASSIAEHFEQPGFRFTL